MRRKTGIVLALLAAALLAALALGLGREKPAAQGNLIENGNFSARQDGEPVGWEKGMWITSEGVSFLSAETLADGTTAALIENVAANDARFEQRVAVRENTLYRLSARVMAQGCGPEKTGANLSFIGVYGTSDCAWNTDGQWTTLTLYARTGKGQREATVGCRVGGYGAENTGRAWFTDVELVEADALPAGMTALDIATPAPAKKAEKKEGPKDLAIPALLLTAAAYLAAALLLTRLLRAGRKGKTSARLLLALSLAAALLVRGVLALTVEGYGVDMGCYAAWAYRMASGGPANFYQEGYFCDYPPAYLLVLAPIGLLANAFSISLSALPGQALLKLGPILFDLALALLFYAAGKREAGERPAAALAALIALNPAFIVTGSAWGQIDALLALLLVLMLLHAKRGEWQFAIPLFALAVLVKPQAGLLAPLGLFALARECRGHGKRIGVGLLAGVAVTLAVTIPFSLKQENPLWLVELYVKTLSSYDYATLSTGNLMFLLGGNWKPNASALVGPLTYGQLGMALMALSFAAGIAVYLKDRRRLMLSAALTMQLVFALGGKMHERYILPALALLLLAYLETGDLRLLGAFAVSSAASAVNIGIVLAYDYLIAPNLLIGYAISVVQLLSAGLTLWAAVSLSLGREPVRFPKRSVDAREEETAYAADARMRRELLGAQDEKLHMRPIDWTLMLALTGLYAAVAFWNLGAAKAPQTGYVSTMEGESVTFDLGEKRENFAIYYYGGISDTQFSFAVSDDGEAFGEEDDAYFDRGECFKWQALRSVRHDEDGVVTGADGDMFRFDGRYLRVTFKDAGSALWEIAAVSDKGPLPIAVCAASGGTPGREDDPQKLVDEQDAVPETPSYMNSMYFDEIYHARTGYEHAHALHTYETTHPPLGKVFMSWFIRLWGMTPFAWRFAGALCGMLMIPAMYLLAKQLLGKTLWAFLCALLLSSDCMHFTQTRIATIDSFPVLFIMLAFLCMARWMKMSFYHDKLWKTFVPLALSGLFMGLSIASKWIGCYAAVGLAALFFARLCSLWRQSAYAKKHRDEHPAFAYASENFSRLALATCAACVVFFVIVPVVVYVLSYIPYLRAYGEVKWNARTFQRIWDAQTLMFDYHKNLVAEHYFSSPWYEWPVIAKPMWYYNAPYKQPGMASSILSFGNPAVWWTGLAAILFTLGCGIWRNALPAARILPGRDDEIDRAVPVIAVGFLSAYLPWVLVSRLTFIYHYFASVPFIILATAQTLRCIERRRPRIAYALTAALCVAALALFVAFYPLASGMETPRAWCDAVSWFKNWMWY